MKNTPILSHEQDVRLQNGIYSLGQLKKLIYINKCNCVQCTQDRKIREQMVIDIKARIEMIVDQVNISELKGYLNI